MAECRVVAPSPDLSEWQVILPPAERSPCSGIELADGQRSTVKGPGRGHWRHWNRRQVPRCSQYLQHRSPNGDEINHG
jgi:hypothetical protein